MRLHALQSAWWLILTAFNKQPGYSMVYSGWSETDQSRGLLRRWLAIVMLSLHAVQTLSTESYKLENQAFDLTSRPLYNSIDRVPVDDGLSIVTIEEST